MPDPNNPDSADTGKSAVPGPFRLDAADHICEHNGVCSVVVLMPLLHEYAEPGEAARFRALLNKGTHYDAMLAALEAIREDICEYAGRVGPAAMLQMQAAINDAKAEGRDDG